MTTGKGLLKNLRSFLFLSLAMQMFGNAQDTIRISLQINEKAIPDPSKHIVILLKTSSLSQKADLSTDLVILSNNIADSTEVIIIYKNKEISKCFKYSPDDLRNAKSWTIELFTSKRAIKKHEKDRPGKKPKRVGIMTTYWGRYCQSAYW